MSERKVLTKYYPPDFDPSKIARTRGPKEADKRPPVRLMTPFSMRCDRCGGYIYKGRKFNARKETPQGERYLSVQRYRFYIRCPTCSGEIIFITDPKNMDYVVESGAKRNFEPWWGGAGGEGRVEETDEETLARLEQEEQDYDPMQELETKMHDAQRDMAVADALDEIRARNARIEKGAESEDVVIVRDVVDEMREKQEKEDEEAARRAFQSGTGDRIRRLDVEIEEASPAIAQAEGEGEGEGASVPTFKKKPKAKKNFAAALGIKRKTAAA